jgi:hypothetical protein
MKIGTAVVFVSLSLGIAHASDFIGAYALIDKVTLEPDAEHPQRVQISGVFAMANPDDRTAYLPPQRGYLYFALPTNRQELALKEWSDLKALTGTHTVISLGSRNQFHTLRVRKTDEKPASPDVYQLGFGLIQNRSNTEYSPIKSLLEYR